MSGIPEGFRRRSFPRPLPTAAGGNSQSETPPQIASLMAYHVAPLESDIRLTGRITFIE